MDDEMPAPAPYAPEDDRSVDDQSRDDRSMDDQSRTGGASPARAGSMPAQTAAILHPSKRQPAKPKNPKDSRAEDAIGRVLGSYKLLEVIGRGGMGRVYRAEHTRLGRQVALKLLRPEYAVKRDAVARFFQEAKAVNKIRHRNIVEVTDYVELDNGTTFIIMELLEGASLGRALRQHGPMDAPRLLAILVQVCDALEAAHAVGIVHRDLKPDNVFLVQEDGMEVAKLLDFGVAKLVAHDDDSVDEAYQTAAGSVVGTPAYMSPEQAAGLEVDGRSDVYSLGAIMYELFCGQPLFRGRSFGDFVVKHMSEPPVPPRQTPGGAAMRPELEQIILRCLAKSSRDRFQTVGELRDRLYQHLGELDGGVGLVEMRNPRLSGVRQAVTPVSSRRSGQRDAIAEQLVQSAPGLAGVAAGLQATPPPARVTELASAMDISSPEADEAVSPSSNGHDTRMVMGDLAGSPPSSSGRKRRVTWPMYTAGAAVVAVGAFFYATGIGRDPVVAPAAIAGDGATLPPGPQPTVSPLTPAEPAPAPTPPKLVPVKLAVRTDPADADVFVYGSDESLCRTPCPLTIDPYDGGSTKKRVFTLKRGGFQDYQLDVPLDGSAPADAFVILMPDEDAHPVAPAPTPSEEPAVEKPERGKKDREKPDRGEKPAESPTVAAPEPTPEETPPEETPPPKTEPPPKKKDKIDRADTLDPFGNK
jgi:serine/threonine protein kinase